MMISRNEAIKRAIHNAVEKAFAIEGNQGDKDMTEKIVKRQYGRDITYVVVKTPEGVPLTDMELVDCVCLLYTSPSPRDRQKSRMPSSA